ncbi:hypothetical protein LXH13_36235 [Streptomyces spinosirectus]|jgi:hypothetical protein|uniref:hypothetical protein n=1 Tax=Streptomyces TaxID=1883 RepID=UPI001C9D85BA|nr:MULTISPECIES: hypothetical protein [Streptomyces]MBY8346033.1 hypothetical protein [Streptomyces plumbidurans]UIR22154.1 hypothetical protein LXH13_36235 [Streptomyces spinosirectus]
MNSEDAQVLLNEIEGHLLIAATREEGRTAAARFSAPFDWLPQDRREEVERRFETEYLALARASWQHTAERAAEVRDEYEAAYRDLRRRLLAGWLLACAALMAAGVVLVPLTRL